MFTILNDEKSTHCYPLFVVSRIAPESAQFLSHLVITISRIVVHVVPEINGDALVALAHMMKPQTGQVQNVASVHTDLLHGCLCILRMLLQIGLQWVDADPFHGDWCLRFICAKMRIFLL